MKTLACLAAAALALAACRDSSAPNPEASGPGSPPYPGQNAPP